ncbi:hypothetical protein FRX31_008116 [Thalictrum thalictroides]|uniref:Uncharacterized protein n=1 Tax=Thalictrum thalictroides TaxID=46969 RepID=A0A7J6VYV5_THATH|nr:hypothetical protein FRX31_021129 [Thalictrum thalictroides]KAF5202297.1 hypothetical protein FRX31_008116 [Thalictrum thalictroides]
MEIKPFIAAFDRWPEDGLVESSDGAGPDQAIGSIVSTRDGSLLSEGPLPLDPFKAFLRVKQATLVPMIHPVLSTSCGSEASPPHVPIHGSKP